MHDWSCPVGKFECPDESCDCPYTRWELCSLHAHATELDMGTRIQFMTCYDSANIPYSADWADDIDPMYSAQSCINSTLGFDHWEAVQTCAGNISGGMPGYQSEALMIEAAQYFYDTFPNNRGTESSHFNVPHLYINNQEQALNNLVSMWNTTHQLCKNGASAAAVCASVEKAKEPDWQGATLLV